MQNHSGIINISPQRAGGVGKFNLSVQSWYYDNLLRSSWHCHCGFCEIVVCCHGSARNEDERGMTMLAPGDVLFFAPDSIHRYVDIRSFRYYNLLCLPDIFPFLGGGVKSLARFYQDFFSDETSAVRRYLSPENLPKAIEILEEMRGEYSSWRDDREGCLFAGFCKIFTFFKRYSTAERFDVDSSAYQIGRVVQYMERNASNGVSVRDAAQFAGMSESNFRHHFQKLIGVSPMEYLLKQRLHLAVLALLSGASVSEAALAGGFADVSYFCRIFKQRFQKTPLKVRQEFFNGTCDPDDYLN